MRIKLQEREQVVDYRNMSVFHLELLQHVPHGCSIWTFHMDLLQSASVQLQFPSPTVFPSAVWGLNWQLSGHTL